jgi:hypothetical protein
VEEYQLKRKCLAVGIILLFVGIIFSPMSSANDKAILPKTLSFPTKTDMVSITVLEYKPDGTVEITFVNMTQEQAKRLRTEIRNTKETDARLSIYKKYHLIPQDVTDEKLKSGLEEKIQRFGPEIKKLQNFMTYIKSNNFLSDHFCIRLFCKVETWALLSLRFLFGLSFITSVINYYLYDLSKVLPSIDLFQMNIGFAGDLHTTHIILPDAEIGGLGAILFILGFVGYSIAFPIFSPFPSFFITDTSFSIGYAIAVFGFVAQPLGPYQS